MKFSVEAPTPAQSSMFNSSPEWPCHLGHEECSFRPGGPCSDRSEPCTCETTGRCRACVPNRVEGGRIP